MEKFKVISLRFKLEQYDRLKQVADSELIPVNSYCMRAVMSSVLKSSVIAVKRDNKGKFVKLE